ncbi:MAG: clostripain-related cysteine peptidase [Myxococcota bacterium]
MTWLLLACAPATQELGGAPRERRAGEGGDGSETDTSVDGAPDTGEEDGEGDDRAEWTVMVFLNGDNDLERWALVDLNEMEAAGESDRVHVVVQLDRSDGFDTSDGDWVGTRRYRVRGDGDRNVIRSELVEDLGAVDSGDPDAVVDFARWAAEAYPARRYALVLWDHGNGWSLTTESATAKGVSWDYTTGNSISVARGELGELLDDVTEALRRPVDLLGMDACLMQTWEIAWVAQPYARVYVASQDYEDVTGWAYDWTLADLYAEPDMDAASLGESIALRFHESADSTQSVLDLEALPALTDALDAFAASALDAGQAGDVLSAAAPAQGFDGEWSRDHDLADLFEHLSLADAAATSAADLALARLSDVVLANYTMGESVRDAHGLSIFSPVDGEVPDLYLDAPWSEETLWDDLIVAAGRGRGQ